VVSNEDNGRMQCNAEAARWLACARQDKALARLGAVNHQDLKI